MPSIGSSTQQYSPTPPLPALNPASSPITEWFGSSSEMVDLNTCSASLSTYDTGDLSPLYRTGTVFLEGWAIQRVS